MMPYRTSLIKPPNATDDRFFGDVQTQGIIEVVLYADPKSAAYTREFAKTLESAKVIDTCRNIWDFLKKEIPYNVDKPGYQWIKSPGRLWQEKSGDCKSFSIFTASILKNLGIPYGYRFVSFEPNDEAATHVYVYVPQPGKKEIIIDAVWSGPFNTEKKYCHKQDYPMAKTYYLGATATRRPGELKIETPIDQLTDAELDMLLLRQNLEIKKMNAGIGSIGAYDEPLKTINHCLANKHNPDFIIGIGEALEEGYRFREAIGAAQIGLFKSKRRKQIEADLKKNTSGLSKKDIRKQSKAQLKKETGKTGAGRFLQKVGKGLKTAGKAVLKVVTAPMRLIAKGAMEIYLPKAAPFFLYLFIPDSQAASLPDMMKRKRKKAEKFKKFVVKALGMKEVHFMKIVGNALEKKYKMPPAKFIADKIKNRVSGIGNPKARYRAHVAGISGADAAQRKAAFKAAVSAKKIFAPRAQEGYNSTLESTIPRWLNTENIGGTDPVPMNLDPLNNEPKKTFKLEPGKLVEAGEKLASGNVVGAVLQALSWLISKISSLFKGEKMEPISADDLPDIERDVANVFEYRDSTEDYSNLTADQKQRVKDVTANLIASGRPSAEIWKALEQLLSFLNTNQRQEIFQEILEGAEALDHTEGQRLANNIYSDNGNYNYDDAGYNTDVDYSNDNNGSDSGGTDKKNNTAIIVLAAVAAVALLK